MSGDEKPTQSDMDRYREDVRTIRDILVSVERLPLYENWVFHAWGALLIVGSLIHYLAVTRLGFSHHRDFLLVWLPVLIIAGGLELTSYLRNVMKQKLPFFSRAFMRVFAGLTGMVGALALVIIILNHTGAEHAVPVVLLLGVSVFFLLIGQHAAYTHVLSLGYVTLAACVVIYVLELNWELTSLLAGISAGIILICAGVLGGRALHAV